MGALIPLLRRAPRGDGHPVLVLPGLGAGDRSTTPLRWFLRDRGYFVHGWRLGTNLGPTDEITRGMRALVERLSDQHGQLISVIGWSMGGIYAREIARRTPHVLRQVVTLGSPFRMARFGGPLQVPATSVYSRSDGVVDWEQCKEPPGPRRESIEVRGSHTGLGHNPAVMLLIADRLAQPEGTWTPFEPTSRWRRLGGVVTSQPA
jgi:pimeloyl-ACP methyl ester carboxylesterase